MPSETNSPEITQDKDPEEASGTWWSRTIGSVPKSVQRYSGIGLVLGLALVIVLVMRNFSSDVAGNRQESLRMTAEALAQPTIDSITGGLAGSLLPSYAGAGGASDFTSGISRDAQINTIIPSRPRVDLATYEVKLGDNLFGIAESYGLEPQSILWANFGVLEDNPNFIEPGQVLNIMPVDGVLHDYRAGESLTSIADFYETSVVAIVEWPGNHLDPFDINIESPPIADGTALIVPGGSRALKDWGPPAITRDNPAVAAYYGPGACGAISSGAIGNGSFVWPTVATYLSGFDFIPQLHSGIDIAGGEGNAIYAADSGVVVYAGWSNSGYGILLVIDHGTGWQTAYAHLQSVRVGCGTSVSQGEVVAALGNTGNSSGPHLHFEMNSLIYGKVNPWNYLIQ
ncbi:MAG: M23 family peptidase [Chloroflexi bacterium]|nr:M23 family metallopeptidase [Chloroflexota bacterium]MQC26831.1 M23 family peptidase [Chloroflexota bacterium]